MLKIRFQRVGKKNRPHFRLVVTESTSAAKKGALEILGFWDPLKKEKAIRSERVKHWLAVGAQTSASAHNFLVLGGVISGPKIPVHKKNKKEPAAFTPEAEAQTTKPQQVDAPENKTNEKQQA